MARNFRDIFTATQKSLRDDPARSLAVFSADTRQLAGLLSEATVRDFRFKLDEPPAFGGRDQAPNPIEYVLAALGACQEITYRYYADTLGIPLHGVSVKVTGRLDLRGLFGVEPGVRPGLRDVHACVAIDSPADADELERLKAMVDRHCPVLDMLRNVTPVKTEHRVVNSRVPTAA
ncbi:MAG: OsmC family protein [Dongiaceae bacterium]